MIIKEPRHTPRFFRKLRRFFSLRVIVALLILFFILFAGFFIVTRKYGERIRNQGYTGTGDFIKTVVSNFATGLFSKTPDMVIDIKHKDFQKLAWKRQQALERGLIVNDEDSWVPATISFEGKTVKVEMRLKGHMPDHIQGDKWSFRIKVDGKGTIGGMRRISLQHPGTRGYINEWIYHQLQKQEGVMALRYRFVDVTVNGKDLGIYALEENFDEELAENNERPEGPVMRFDPSIYWEYRLREIHGSNTEHDYGTFTSTVLEPYRFNKTIEDPSQKKNFLKALDLMEGFRSGTHSTSDVFDLELMASFHAIIDLMGGHHSLDWSDVKFYYNKVSGKLEPVAYESFGILPAWTISGAGHFKPENPQNYHQLLFSDTLFFQKYIAAVERISMPEYLDSFFTENDSALNHNLASLYREFPYKKYRKDLYYENQKRMREFLNHPSAIRAFLKNRKDSTVLTVGSVSNLPIVIEGISINGKFHETDDFIILKPKVRNSLIQYEDIRLNTLIDEKADPDSVYINYRVLGASKSDSSIIRLHRFADIREEIVQQRKSNINDFKFLKSDTALKQIMIIPGKWVLNQDLIIPSGWILSARPGVDLTLSGSTIRSQSALSFKGEEESPVIIRMNGKSSFIISATDRTSILQNVLVDQTGSDKGKGESGLVFYEAGVSMQNLKLIESGYENAIAIHNSQFNIRNLVVDSSANDALDISFSEGEIINSWFNNCKEDGIDINFSDVSIKNCRFNDIGNKGINASAKSKIVVFESTFNKGNTGISAEDEAEVNIQSSNFNDLKTGIQASLNKEKFKPGQVLATDISFSNVAVKGKINKGAHLTINGEVIKKVEK